MSILVSLLIFVIVVCFAIYLLQNIPMNALMRNIIIGVLAILALVFLFIHYSKLV